MESSRGLVDERDAPISCVLGEEWLSLPGWRLTLLGMRGGRGQDVTGQGEAGEVRGGGHPHQPLTTPPTPRSAASTTRRVGRAGGQARRVLARTPSQMQEGSWGRGWRASSA